MRKLFALFLVLTVLAGAGIITAHGMLTERQDDIVITETTVYGDKAAADNVTATIRSQDHRRQMMWETVYHTGVGGNSSISTDFVYNPGGNNYRRDLNQDYYAAYTNQYYGIMLYSASTDGGIGGSDIDLGVETDDVEANAMYRLARVVAERTEKGETRTETLKLKDFYDYYPITVDFDMPYGNYNRGVQNWQETTAAIADCFRYPVMDDHELEVSVTRSELGPITQVESRSTGDVWVSIQSDGIVTEDAIYFFVTGSKPSFSASSTALMAFT